MSQFDVRRIAYRVSLSLVGLALLSPIVTAQSVKVEGLITPPHKMLKLLLSNRSTSRNIRNTRGDQTIC